VAVLLRQIARASLLHLGWWHAARWQILRLLVLVITLIMMCCVLLYTHPQMGYVIKKDLQKKKNDEEVEEGWVQCDCCDNWVHMICGLFNKGKNDQNVHYLCPTCLVDVSSSRCCYCRNQTDVLGWWSFTASGS